MGPHLLSRRCLRTVIVSVEMLLMTMVQVPISVFNRGVKTPHAEIKVLCWLMVYPNLRQGVCSTLGYVRVEYDLGTY